MGATIAPDRDVAALLARIGALPKGITADSRRVRAGDAFAAFPGTKADGRAFIPDAIRAGAGLVLWEFPGFAWNPAWQVAQVAVEGLAAKLGAIADAIHGHPSRSLWIVGVTGTNGKTSCSQWIAQCFAACGRRAAVIGTLGHGLVGAVVPAERTTPDAARVHELLAQFRDAGASAVAMEASSHGLDQGRVNAVGFDVALFTNLTRDHLDYHGTMAAYGAAKAKLFTWPGLRTAVINADDPFGQGLVDLVRRNGGRVLTYGSAGADIHATDVEMTSTGLAMSVVTPWGRGEVRAPVTGAFNAVNLMGVLGVLLASGTTFSAALTALSRIEAPAGRMQRLGGGALPLVVVDYAHSPDSLEKVLLALRPAVGPGHELVCVFGCGGDRDRGKRAQMGEVAGRLADRLVVTSDNPRGEDPAAIASAIVSGIRGTANRRWSVEPDRAHAIHAAIAAARSGDVVLVAGKGHEDYQEMSGVRHHFSDAQAAAAALAEWSGA
jgi:UDP-N-acetylmuramoyl-L-alanyl-D-glutamate--2,6-diaminopimelate ligase